MRSARIGALAFGLSVAALGPCFAAPPAPIASPPAGRLEGVADGGVKRFLGIPYAKAPVGPLRFRSPEPAEVWSGVRKATQISPPCAQSPFRGMNERTGVEDCLQLNVYAPASAKPGDRLPVMLWIHGGAMQFGSASQYDGSRLAERQKVVVVTINYRLGVLGLLAHPALTAQAAPGLTSGQYALEDQQLAMKWVRRNIEAFGGDARNLTVFGESAGGDSVCWHLTSPQAVGLFEKAIIQSGACVRVDGEETLAEGEDRGVKVAAAVGCGGVDVDVPACLRNAPLDALFAAPADNGRIAATWRPKTGAGLLPLGSVEAYASGRFDPVPVLIGVTRNEYDIMLAMEENAAREPLSAEHRSAKLRAQYDAVADKVDARYPVPSFRNPGQSFAQIMTDSVFACPSSRLWRAMAVRAPVFVYEFAEARPATPPGQETSPSQPDGLRAYHGSEIAYVFQAPLGPFGPVKAGFTLGQARLSDRMQQAWADFARTGRPAAQAQWPSFGASGKVMILDQTGPALDSGFDERHQCGFWAGPR